MDAHRMVWVYAIGFISIVGLFVLGGSLIKNGVIFGLLLTASLVLLFMHGGKGSMEKKTKVALWISKHCAVADWLLAIICGFVFVSAGVTTGIAVSVVSLLTTLLLHHLEVWGQGIEELNQVQD